MPTLSTAQTIAVSLAALAAIYALGLGGLFLAQRRILFRPDQTAPVAARVELAGLEEVRLTTADGLELLAWWVAGARAGEAAPVVLYLHGNAGHIGHRAERVRAVAARGWGGLFVQYRGYGGNPGTPSEAGLRLDAEAGLAALMARGVAAERIVVWGESLGSGLASGLAARHAVGAVVLETPFTSIAAIARQRYPYAPVDLLLKDRFDSLAVMGQVRAPVLVAVAGHDAVVPPAMGQVLLAAAGGPAELWEAPAAGHTELMGFGLMAAMEGFLARRLAK